jgi:type I pantothenate kinase
MITAMRDLLVDDVLNALDRARPLVVGLAGPVGIGKSSLAGEVATALRGAGLAAEVLATDGFLRRSAQLEAEGLLLRKGFPETYDEGSLVAAIGRVRAGDSFAVPVYSHATFDPDDERIVGRCDVLIVEGVNALQPVVAEAADRRWYLDAPDPVVVGWFIERFRRLTERARTEGGFYERFVALDPEGLDAAARHVWALVNQPNLDDHIRPTRRRADLVIDAEAWRAAVSRANGT